MTAAPEGNEQNSHATGVLIRCEPAKLFGSLQEICRPKSRKTTTTSQIERAGTRLACSSTLFVDPGNYLGSHSRRRRGPTSGLQTWT
jgi:hypothetical protein